ncbi:DUF2202 domain-containing protein [Thiocystis violacea]|uniref:DUF2202 domain-containing protein n=1 Tax=Thiocystis violacea TaxID=13725 RepID=UPI0019048B70|nr:DUF2202 domain-containing protein [Thiocystis violacea]MBK1717837.1 hypothetical protein [Thiocystis violacea]
MRTEYSLPMIALTAIMVAAPAFGAGPRGSQPVQPVLADLDAQEAEALIFMREEEKLARDVYLAMDGLWQQLPFENIAQSEQKHMDAVKNAIDNYGLTDPSEANPLGVFTNTTLQQLYTDLTTLGETSYLEALQVGALIEEVDIEDLENTIAATNNLDLQTMYGNLLRGSRNHLRAFVAEIERQGVVYEAQLLSQEAVDEILDSPMERGGNGAGKRGSGSNRLGMADGLTFDDLIARGGNGSGKGPGDGTGTGTGQGRGKGNGQGLNQGVQA